MTQVELSGDLEADIRALVHQRSVSIDDDASLDALVTEVIENGEARYLAGLGPAIDGGEASALRNRVVGFG